MTTFTAREFARVAHLSTATAEEFLQEWAEARVTEQVGEGRWVLTSKGRDISAMLAEIGMEFA